MALKDFKQVTHLDVHFNNAPPTPPWVWHEHGEDQFGVYCNPIGDDGSEKWIDFRDI